MRLTVSRPGSPETGHRGIIVHDPAALARGESIGVDIDDTLDTCGDSAGGLCGADVDVLIVYAGSMMSWQSLYIAPRCAKHADKARDQLRADAAQYVELDA